MIEVVLSTLQCQNKWLYCLLLIVIWWLLWRIWTFSISPVQQFNAVPYLPYSIPVIGMSATVLTTIDGKQIGPLTILTGHAVELFRNTTSLYRRAHQHFRGTRAPYSLQVMSEQIVVVTDPSQMSAIYKDNINYDWNSFIDLVYRKIGNVSEEANTILWRTPAEGFKSLFPNPKNLVLVHTGHELLHKQLLTPGSSQQLLKLGSTYIENALHWGNISQSCMVATGNSCKVLSLHRWCRDVMVGSLVAGFFGPHLLDLQPDFMEVFDQWDINSWMVTYQYPDCLAGAAIKPRETIVKVCKRYLDTPRELRIGGVAFVNELEDEMRHSNLSSEDCARIFMIIMWGINANVQLATFWMISYILQDLSLQSRLLEELTQASQCFSAAKTFGHSTFVEDINQRQQLLDHCPLLNATYNEVLRVCSTGCSVRKTTRQVLIGEKVVPAGVKVLMPQRQSLMDEAVFGVDAQNFCPQRFLDDPKLLRSKFYRPFGGGVSMCSGKVIARYEVLDFVAWALLRFDLKRISTQEVILGVRGRDSPRLDESKPSLGIAKQIEGDDMMVQLSLRTSTSRLRSTSRAK